MKKYQFHIHGLDCANCAAKIESALLKLSGVKQANVNFINGSINIELNQENTQIEKIVATLISKIEPDVSIHLIEDKHDQAECQCDHNHNEGDEHHSHAQHQYQFEVIGLDCANCASKLEVAINGLDGVEAATMNFMGAQFSFSCAKERYQEVYTKIEKTIQLIEPDVRLVEKSKSKSVIVEEKDDSKIQLIKIVVAVVLMILGFMVKDQETIRFILFTIAYLVVGLEIIARAIKNCLKGQVFDENFLMAIATLGAYALKDYPEAVAVMLFYQVGEYFQTMAVARSRKSIASLMDIRPDYANVLRNNALVKETPESVSIGEIIVIKAGEKIPLDGIVVEGNSSLDTSALTGESNYRNVSIGSDVISGCINVEGMLSVKVSKLYGESTVSKILDLVENASNKKATTENFITKFARYYTPLVVISALFIAFVLPLLIEGALMSDYVYRALTFLVISCPCALVISIPLSYFGGIGGLSKQGILVKGSNYLEALKNTEIVVFDKTGTLTQGLFGVNKIVSENKEELLYYAAHTENFSNHPISRSIVKAYNKEIDESLISDVQEIAGHGIKANVEGHQIVAGNAVLMNAEKITFKPVNEIGTIIHIGKDQQYLGYMSITDQIKKDAKKAIEGLKGIGVKKIVMLTGDNEKVATMVGNELGIDEVHAQLLPQDKVKIMEDLLNAKSKQGKLVFVGDGINDAPVLAQADIGVAMGGLGSDAAIEAADVVIMNDEPSQLISALQGAKRTNRIVLQNIIFALAVKFIVLLLGAIGHATMWNAVFADVGVSVLAILNAIRALNIKR